MYNNKIKVSLRWNALIRILKTVDCINYLYITTTDILYAKIYFNMEYEAHLRSGQIFSLHN